jgi:hypothetical protein
MQRNKTQSEEKYVLSVVHNEEDRCGLQAWGTGKWGCLMVQVDPLLFSF